MYVWDVDFYFRYLKSDNVIGTFAPDMFINGLPTCYILPFNEHLDFGTTPRLWYDT